MEELAEKKISAEGTPKDQAVSSVGQVLAESGQVPPAAVVNWGSATVEGQTFVGVLEGVAEEYFANTLEAGQAEIAEVEGMGGAEADQEVGEAERIEGTVDH